MEKVIYVKTLNIDGTVYKTKHSQKFANRKKWEKPNPGKIVSYIPGTILDVYVKKGMNVSQGDALMILEAMKMKNKVVAPFDGVVKKVNIKSGQIVPKNELLIEIEKSPEQEEKNKKEKKEESTTES